MLGSRLLRGVDDGAADTFPVSAFPNKARRRVQRSRTTGAMFVALALSAAAVGCAREEIVPEPYLPTDAYDAYRHGLEEAGLADTALARDWLRVGAEALETPVVVTAPYREQGLLDATLAHAEAYRFTALRGQRIEAVMELDADRPARVFLDLYRIPEEDDQPTVHVATGDEGERRLAFEPRRDAEYLLRLQPELLRGGTYTLVIRAVAALEFPVEDRDTGDILSAFGAERDAGRRQHHGVDIFAPRGTPVLATTRARVSRVRETEIGGKVVWLRDSERNANHYFAHLDDQEAVEGSWVEAGDVIGRVGNTGNARTTSPHLHFGIYLRGQGPIDPYNYLDNPPSEPSEVRADVTVLGSWGFAGEAATVLLASPARRSETLRELESGTPVRVWAAADRYYRVALSDGTRGFLAATGLTLAAPPAAAE